MRGCNPSEHVIYINQPKHYQHMFTKSTSDHNLEAEANDEFSEWNHLLVVLHSHASILHATSLSHHTQSSIQTQLQIRKKLTTISTKASSNRKPTPTWQPHSPHSQILCSNLWPFDGAPLWEGASSGGLKHRSST